MKKLLIAILFICLLLTGCKKEATQAPETTADTTPVTEPTPSDTPATPATFDAGIIAAVAAIVSAAGYMLAKKK